MIFIAGVSPKTTIIDQTPRLCPVCGLAQARLQRVDHWLSFFFLPVFRVKKGAEFIFCNRCDSPVSGSIGNFADGPVNSEDTCAGCGGNLAQDHRYCPYCGKPRF